MTPAADALTSAQLRIIAANEPDERIRQWALVELACRRETPPPHRHERAVVHEIAPGQVPPEPEREPAPPTREAAWHLISGREDDE